MTCTKQRSSARDDRTFSSLKGSVLHMYTSVHARFQNETAATELRVEGSKSEVWSQLNELFSNDAGPCMLVENDCLCTDMMLSSATGLVDKTTGYTEHPGLTKRSNLYFALLHDLYWRTSKDRRALKLWMLSLKTGVPELKKRTAGIFEKQCKSRLYTMKFLLLHQIWEDLEKFWRRMKLTGSCSLWTLQYFLKERRGEHVWGEWLQCERRLLFWVSCNGAESKRWKWNCRSSINVKGTETRTLQEVGWLLSMHGLEMNLEELVWMNIRAWYGDVEFSNMVLGRFRKPLSKNGMYKLLILER